MIFLAHPECPPQVDVMKEGKKNPGLDALADQPGILLLLTTILNILKKSLEVGGTPKSSPVVCRKPDSFLQPFNELDDTKLTCISLLIIMIPSTYADFT